MKAMKIVRFACGKYGVSDGSSFVSPAHYRWSSQTDVAMYCKMYKWQAKRLLKALDVTVVETFL
jgi:hypothetical protein